MRSHRTSTQNPYHVYQGPTVSESYKSFDPNSFLPPLPTPIQLKQTLHGVSIKSGSGIFITLFFSVYFKEITNKKGKKNA